MLSVHSDRPARSPSSHHLLPALQLSFASAIRAFHCYISSFTTSIVHTAYIVEDSGLLQWALKRRSPLDRRLSAQQCHPAPPRTRQPASLPHRLLAPVTPLPSLPLPPRPPPNAATALAASVREQQRVIPLKHEVNSPCVSNTRLIKGQNWPPTMR